MRMLLRALSLSMLLVFAGPAYAQPTDKSAQPTAADKASAKEAYDRGVKAYDRGDFTKAASEFAIADSFAPSPTALQAALDASVEADDPALGADLLERAKREKSPPPALAKSIAAAKAKFAGRGGFVRVVCPGTSCSATLDGTAFDTTKPAWAKTGPHTLAIEVDGVARPAQQVDVKPDETIDVQPSDSPPPAASVDVATSKKLPPLVFYVGAGATGVAALLTTVFAFGAQSAHGDFTDAGCQNGTGVTETCASLRDDGEGAVTRTNVALVSTLVLSAATAALGLFFTDWNASARSGRSPASLKGWTIAF